MDTTFTLDHPEYNPPPGLPDILHRDDDILVLNKPSGLLHVAGKDPRLFDCLALRVRKIFPTASIIHRLDCDTSGVVVMGMNKRAHAHIAQQFEKRTIAKTYIARIAGYLEGVEGTVNEPIGPDMDRRPRQRIDQEKGRPALTEWAIMEHEGTQATRVRLHPRTGRTHQLRVHMEALGHPILGDRLYGTDLTYKAAPRLQLHASQIEFVHPSTLKPCIFCAPCPF